MSFGQYNHVARIIKIKKIIQLGNEDQTINSIVKSTKNVSAIPAVIII